MNSMKILLLLQKLRVIVLLKLPSQAVQQCVHRAIHSLTRKREAVVMSF